jgi:hypothetical protein
VTTSNTKGVGHLQLIPEVGLGTQLAWGSIQAL